MSIKHYKGKLGEFDYDDSEFELDSNDYHEYMRYIGKETDGSKIKIPEGIEDCESMFSHCESLVKPPVIPKGVKKCRGMFAFCTSLKKAPVIPDGVKECQIMFYCCTSLKKAPIIPKSVERYNRIFNRCSKNVQKAHVWNVKHRGQDYYKDSLEVQNKKLDKKVVDMQEEIIRLKEQLKNLQLNQSDFDTNLPGSGGQEKVQSEF